MSSQHPKINIKEKRKGGPCLDGKKPDGGGDT